MSVVAFTIVCMIASYLVCGIPFGLLVAKTKGVDVRKAGSGNIGMTNVARTVGGKAAALTFLLDVFKGTICVPFLARPALSWGRMGAHDPTAAPWLVGILCVGLVRAWAHLLALPWLSRRKGHLGGPGSRPWALLAGCPACTCGVSPCGNPEPLCLAWLNLRCHCTAHVGLCVWLYAHCNDCPHCDLCSCDLVAQGKHRAPAQWHREQVHAP